MTHPSPNANRVQIGKSYIPTQRNVWPVSGPYVEHWIDKPWAVVGIILAMILGYVVIMGVWYV
jgi:hypothetical protein